jgi:hypothetical protein
MKIDIDHTTEKDNIILTLHAFDGRTCKIAVPKEDGDNFWVWDGGKNTKPIGLNLVTNPPGHHYE